MASRTPIEQTEGLYFIAFTCGHWLPLFEIVEGYDTAYKWFDYLKMKNHYVKGYIIMPNHLHVLIDFSASCKSINTIVSNGKRFIAYEIVKRLQEQKEYGILNKLQESVASSDKDRGKKHQVFERSFDCKPITTQHFFIEKLNYIHNNPCSGVWKLVENPVDYKHSYSKTVYCRGRRGISH
jgi:REP element-mobilizing transposase RayT